MMPVQGALALAVLLVLAMATTATVTRSGLAAGGLLAFLFAWRGGWFMLGGFFLFVVLGTLASRLRCARKRDLGLERAERGRRSAVHALANAGPACAFLLAIRGPFGTVAALGCLSAALSDTVSGEIGQLAKSHPRILLFGRLVARGEDGGMTWLGTLAGIAAAVPVALMAWPNDQVGVFLGGVVGTLTDSALGATIERHLPKPFANAIVNATATIAGGALALATHEA